MLNDKQSEYWYQLAKHDQETSEILIKENGYPDVIIYHLHQAIEKILKGLILNQGISFPYIHDLERLYAILTDKNKKYKGLIEQIITLQSFYKNLRYPQSNFLNDEDLEDAKIAYDKILSSL